MFNIVGCDSEDGPPLKGWQAFHADSKGDGWRGPIRMDYETAIADADAYASTHQLKPDEIMVLAIYPEMDTRGQLPPNPLAERALATPITLEAITGFWEIVDGHEQTNNAKYFIDIRADGKCKTSYGARFTERRVDGFDTVEVLTDSAINLALSKGESYIFAVTQFDGDQMTVLVDGWKEQLLTLTRKPHPSGLKLSEPEDAR
ncbi:MAG: hypothetical protein KDA37_17455 [Planctomycetales bacterium]|nr:hypothetical protein [Planctomycetales bacterium]